MKLKRSTGTFTKANPALRGNEVSENLQDLLGPRVPGRPLVRQRHSVSLRKKCLFYSRILSMR
ncbi:hypothetical protein I309_06620 [Cryptococcus deuterogattii LA55]|nr:hypothetical protein I309_06620 [Cryptococcus deuterogattii LA55]KIR89700.1 hypothetical protein I304_06418 [Cryptococcus deuterogattii CBS 10090]